MNIQTSNHMKEYLLNKRVDKIMNRFYTLLKVLKYVLILVVVLYALSILTEMHKIALCFSFNEYKEDVINCFFDN